MKLQGVTFTYDLKSEGFAYIRFDFYIEAGKKAGLKSRIREAFDALDSIVENEMPKYEHLSEDSGEQTNNELRFCRHYTSSRGLDAEIEYSAEPQQKGKKTAILKLELRREKTCSLTDFMARCYEGVRKLELEYSEQAARDMSAISISMQQRKTDGLYLERL